MKRWSSLRRTGAPIPVRTHGSLLRRFFARGRFVPVDGFAIRRPSASRAAAAHGARAGGDRLDDVVIAGAAADIAFELLADGAVVEIVALAAHDIDRGHDHAGRAIAALQPVIFAERFLHRMQRAVGRRRSLDGQHVGALELQREHGAGFHRLAVDMHDAGAALRGVAADMGAG